MEANHDEEPTGSGFNQDQAAWEAWLEQTRNICSIGLASNESLPKREARGQSGCFIKSSQAGRGRTSEVGGSPIVPVDF